MTDIKRKNKDILSDILDILKANYVTDSSTELNSYDLSRIKQGTNTPRLKKLKQVQSALTFAKSNLDKLLEELNNNIKLKEQTE